MANTNAPSWRDESAASKLKKPSRQKQIFKILFTMCALIGVIMALIYLVQPAKQPYFVPICITEYKDRRIPVNAQAEQDRVALQEGKYFSIARQAFASQEGHKIHEELRDLESRKRSELVVLYLSAHMLPDASGQLALIPGNASIDDPTARIPLKDILNSLKNCPSKQKLLVLDTFRPVADPRLGVLANDMASRVPQILDEIPDEGRLVLCACSPGQTSLTSEDLQQSVFGFYVEEGLCGWADGYNPENRLDGRVTVQELFRFVRARIDRWASMNRKAKQTPVLYGDGNFDLVVVEGGKPKPMRDLPEEREYPVWLRTAWQLRDQWWDQQFYRTAPRLFRLLEANILRAEQHWRGGGNESQVQANLEAQIKQIKEHAAKVDKGIPRPDPPRSLALAVALGKKPDPEMRAAVDKLLITLENIQIQVKAEERPAARKKEIDDFSKAIKDKTVFDLASAAFESISQDTNPRWEKINTLQDILKINQRLPHYVETLHLLRVEDLGKSIPPNTWSKELVTAVYRSLLATREGEKALACLAVTGWEPRSLPWMQKAIASASQKRHNAEMLLFSPGYGSLARATKLFDEAIVEYQLVNKDLEDFKCAFRARDEALAQLPALVPWLMANPDGAENWRDVVDNLMLLQAALTEPPRDKELTNETFDTVIRGVRRHEDLRNAMAQLMRPVRDHIPGLIVKTEMLEYDPAVLADIDAVLETSCLPAKDREKLWTAQRRLARKILERTRQLDTAEPEKQRQAPPPLQFDTQRAMQEENARTEKRARIAVDLLRIGDLPAEDVSVVTALLPIKPDTLATLNNETRLSWATRLPKALAESRTLGGQDRLARIFYPFDGSALLDDEVRNPSVTIVRDKTLDLWRFIGDHYHYERIDLAGVDPQDPYGVSYRQWSEEYLRHQAEPYRPWSLTFSTASDTPNLRERKSVSYPITIVPEGPVPKGDKVLTVETADEDWLNVTVPQINWTETGPWDLPLDVALKPGAASSNAPAPRGFLAVARVNQRTFHSRVSALLPQPDSQRLQLLLCDQPKDTGNPIGTLRLRPNTKQQVYILAKNPTDQPKKVVVELRTEAGTTTSDVVELPAKDTKHIVISKAAAPAPGAKAELPELKGKMLVQLRDAENRKNLHDQKSIDVEIAPPQHYVQITRAQYIPEKKQLIVRVKATPSLVGPPCRVQLVLPPERITGFIKAGSGTFEGTLNKPDDEINLIAEELQFDESRANENGYFYVTVDGYERAFIFSVTFARQSATNIAARDVQVPAIRLKSGRYARTDEVFRTSVEVDTVPPDVRLVVDFQRTREGGFHREMEMRGGRQQRVGFTPAGPEGSLQFETQVNDWPIALNVKGIIGERQLRVRMLSTEGRELLVDNRAIMLDDSAPEGRITSIDGKAPQSDPPLSIEKASSVVLKTEASDKESGIKEVLYFLGKPIDGKLPPNAKIEKATSDDKKAIWTGRLGLPQQKGEIEITAQIINGVGLSTFDTVRIDLKEPAPPPPPDKEGKIKGTVVSGDRKQPNVDVMLLDEQNKEKAKTKTAEDGSFKFDKVAPGTYKVRAFKASSREGGSEAVNVEAGKTSEVKIGILRE